MNKLTKLKYELQTKEDFNYENYDNPYNLWQSVVNRVERLEKEEEGLIWENGRLKGCLTSSMKGRFSLIADNRLLLTYLKKCKQSISKFIEDNPIKYKDKYSFINLEKCEKNINKIIEKHKKLTRK